MEERELKAIIEALLFVWGDPLSIEDISNILEIDKNKIKDILSNMIDEFDFYDVLSKEEIRAWKNVVINKIRNPVNNYLVEPSYIKVDTITGFIDKLVPAIASLI